MLENILSHEPTVKEKLNAGNPHRIMYKTSISQDV